MVDFHNNVNFVIDESVLIRDKKYVRQILKMSNKYRNMSNGYLVKLQGRIN